MLAVKHLTSKLKNLARFFWNLIHNYMSFLIWNSCQESVLFEKNGLNKSLSNFVNSQGENFKL